MEISKKIVSKTTTTIELDEQETKIVRAIAGFFCSTSHAIHAEAIVIHAAECGTTLDRLQVIKVINELRHITSAHTPPA